jgi:hypothetical protein
MKLNWVRFVVLSLDIFFQATLRFYSTTIKPFISHGTHGQKKSILVSEMAWTMTFSLIAEYNNLSLFLFSLIRDWKIL